MTLLELTRFRPTPQITPEMSLCGKLAVIMQCGFRTHYEDFVHQAVHQGIFGKKFTIAPEHLADMVYKWVTLSGEGQKKASEKTQTFVNMIQDPLRRIYYAEKFHNYDIAIDVSDRRGAREAWQRTNSRLRRPSSMFFAIGYNSRIYANVCQPIIRRTTEPQHC